MITRIKALCIFTSLLFLCGCATTMKGEGTTDSSEEGMSLEAEGDNTEALPDYAERHYPLAEIADKIKPVGRVFWESNGLACDHTASGIEFNAYIQGELRIVLQCDRITYFTIFLDGERLTERFRVPGGNQSREITVDISEE